MGDDLGVGLALELAAAAISSSRSGLKFSMMPLWTSATGPTMCGCALPTVGAPCVAQRVWAMPTSPAQRIALELERQIVELAFGAAADQLAIVERADAGAVVAAIFHPPEAVDQPLRDFGFSDNSDDSAHADRTSYEQSRSRAMPEGVHTRGSSDVAHIVGARKHRLAV